MAARVDASWVNVEPDHPLLPIRMKLPPNLEGAMSSTSSPTRALYVVSLGPGLDGVLQFAVDDEQSPDHFATAVKEGGSTFEQSIRSTSFVGLPATEACGTIKTPLRRAFVKGSDGRLHERPAYMLDDRHFSYYVNVGDRVFRAGYRISQQAAPKWEPVFQAILGTIEWR